MDSTKLQLIPTTPGVYLMKDQKGDVLYVGKAKNLRARIKQYFALKGDERPMVPYLMEKVETIDTVVVTSEKEALILENNLIKQYKPHYNVLLKDDKTYIALKVNTRHRFPMVTLVRIHGKPKADGHYFGPFSSAFGARETLDTIQKLFPLRQCSDQELLRRTRPCILYDMKRCAAPCVGKCSDLEYNGMVQETLQFLRGNNKEVLLALYKEMELAAEGLRFEEAAEILQRIRAVEKTIEKQHVDQPLGEDLDVIGLHRKGDQLSLASMIYRGGRLMGVNQFHFQDVVQEEDELLSSFILQHYTQKELLPKEIVVPLSLSNTLSQLVGVPLFTPHHGKKRAYLQIAEENAKAALHALGDEKTKAEKTLLEMQEKLHLSRYPRKIDCVDNSNLGGVEPVSAVVRFTDGKPEKNRYRKFKIKEAAPDDDYAIMAEVLTRHLTRLEKENELPDLLVVDGGKGQLSSALQVLKKLNIISVDVVSVVKERGRHDRGLTLERVFVPDEKEAIVLGKHSPLLFMLQKIRDEAHRFAITYQRTVRSKERIRSQLEQIPGIGAVKRRLLLKHLGSVQRIKNATLEEIKAVPKISETDARVIFAYFKGT